MKLVLDRAHDIEDFEAVVSFLNETTASLPLSESIKNMYDILFNPFYTHLLAVSNLNRRSGAAP